MDTCTLYTNDLPQRFWDSVDEQGPLWKGVPCWVWMGRQKSRGGYGVFYWNGRTHMAHRVSYMALVASIPDGLQIDHLCRNRLCVNPGHLEAVTHLINRQRATKPGKSPRIPKLSRGADRVPELPQRFWDKVDKAGPEWQGIPCWVWQSARDRKGYGHFTRQGRSHYAHRLSYLSLVGPIPAGLILDHRCRNRLCVNPAHLEAVPPGVNTRRGRSVKSVWLPCALCGDPDGPPRRGGLTPGRTKGTLFGITGALCQRCYGRLTVRAQYRRTGQ